MCNKVKEYYQNSKLLRIVFIILIVPISVFIAKLLLTSGINLGTFIRRLLELVKC